MPNFIEDLYRKQQGERVREIDAQHAPVKLYDYFAAKDLNDTSIGLSDLTPFLETEDPTTFKASIEDLSKLNVNRLKELSKKYIEIFYKEVAVTPANNLRRRAMHALLLATIKKTLLELKERNANLQEIVDELSTIIQPANKSGNEHNLLKDFVDYEDPYKQKIQEVMSEINFDSSNTDPEILKKFRVLCFDTLGIGKKDLDIHKDKLLANKKKLEHTIGVLNRKDADADRKVAVAKIIQENTAAGSKLTPQQEKDILEDYKNTLQMQLEMVRSHLGFLHAPDPSAPKTKQRKQPIATSEITLLTQELSSKSEELKKIKKRKELEGIYHSCYQYINALPERGTKWQTADLETKLNNFNRQIGQLGSAIKLNEIFNILYGSGIVFPAQQNSKKAALSKLNSIFGKYDPNVQASLENEIRVLQNQIKQKQIEAAAAGEASAFLSECTWGDLTTQRGGNGFLTDKEFEKYVALYNDALNKQPPSTAPIILEAPASPDASGWRQIYDVLIDPQTKKCVLVIQGNRGTPTETLLISKGNFGDVAIGFDLFTNKSYAIKKETTKFKPVGATSKLGIVGSLTYDAQVKEEREQESLITKAAGLSVFQAIEGHKAIDEQVLLKDMTRFFTNAKGQTQAGLTGKLNVAKGYETIWTVQELLRSKDDYKDEILQQNEEFKKEAAALQLAIQSKNGNSEFYSALSSIDSATQPAEQLTPFLKTDIEKRFSSGMGYLKGLIELENREILHGDIKPKNFKGGRFFDFGTSWLTTQKSKGKSTVGTMEPIKTGTVEFMPPEYVFHSGGKVRGLRSDGKQDKVNVTVTRQGDIYSAGVSLFGYTDLATYKQAFTWHNPGKPFPYSEPIDATLIRTVGDRQYIKIFNVSDAEGSGLELLDALDVLRKKDQKFENLYKELNSLFESMCHWDPKVREKEIPSAQTAVSRFIAIQQKYQNLLQQSGNLVDLGGRLDELVGTEDVERATKLKAASQTNSQQNLLSKVVATYDDDQSIGVENAIKTITNLKELLGLDNGLSTENCPLLIAAKKNKTKIFNALIEKVEPEIIVDFLDDKANKNRDIIYVAAENNNLEILKKIFEKIKQHNDMQRAAQLILDLIVGNPENTSGYIQKTGYDLLGWAAYNKNDVMLEYLFGELMQVQSLLGISKTQYLDILLPKTTPPEKESIFHAVAYNNASEQFLTLYKVLLEISKSSKHSSSVTFKNLTVDFIKEMHHERWKNKDSLTPFGILFSKNKDFVDAVFSQFATDTDRVELNRFLVNANFTSHPVLNLTQGVLNPIQLAFLENNDEIIIKIFNETTNDIFDLKDNEGNNPLHYLVDKENLHVIEKLVDSFSAPNATGIPGLDAKKAAFLKALTTVNNEGVTPLTLLITKQANTKEQIGRQAKIYFKLMNIAQQSYNDSDAMLFTSGNKDRDSIFIQAIKNKKHKIVEHMMDLMKKVPNPSRRDSLLFQQLQESIDDKNIFHYIFQNKPADQFIETFFSKMAEIAGESGTEKLKSLFDLLFQKAANTTPLELAIESNSHKALIGQMVVFNDKKKGAFDKFLQEILSSPCGLSVNLVEHISKQKNAAQLVKEILVPIVNGIKDKTIKDQVIAMIKTEVESRKSDQSFLEEVNVIMEEHQAGIIGAETLEDCKRQLDKEISRIKTYISGNLDGQWKNTDATNNPTKINYVINLIKETETLLEQIKTSAHKDDQSVKVLLGQCNEELKTLKIKMVSSVEASVQECGNKAVEFRREMIKEPLKSTIHTNSRLQENVNKLNRDAEIMLSIIDETKQNNKSRLSLLEKFSGSKDMVASEQTLKGLLLLLQETDKQFKAMQKQAVDPRYKEQLSRQSRENEERFTAARQKLIAGIEELKKPDSEDDFGSGVAIFIKRAAKQGLDAGGIHEALRGQLPVELTKDQVNRLMSDRGDLGVVQILNDARREAMLQPTGSQDERLDSKREVAAQRLISEIEALRRADSGGDVGEGIALAVRKAAQQGLNARGIHEALRGQLPVELTEDQVNRLMSDRGDLGVIQILNDARREAMLQPTGSQDERLDSKREVAAQRLISEIEALRRADSGGDVGERIALAVRKAAQQGLNARGIHEALRGQLPVELTEEDVNGLLRPDGTGRAVVQKINGATHAAAQPVIFRDSKSTVLPPSSTISLEEEQTIVASLNKEIGLLERMNNRLQIEINRYTGDISKLVTDLTGQQIEEYRHACNKYQEEHNDSHSIESIDQIRHSNPKISSLEEEKEFFQKTNEGIQEEVKFFLYKISILPVAKDSSLKRRDSGLR